MNKQNVPALPDETKMEELLGKIQPIPSERFHQKMKWAAWRGNDRRQPAGVKNLRLKVTFALIVLATLTAVFATPQGRAWAQEFFRFFQTTNSKTISLSENERKRMEIVNEPYDLPLVPVFIPTVSPEMAALSGCENIQRSQSYDCQVALAESQLGLDLKELPAIPDDWKFDFLYFDTVSKNTTIAYSFDLRYRSYGSLYLIQGSGEFPKLYGNSPWEFVPADKVQAVKVGSANGEYVRGSFVGDAEGNNLIWQDANPHQRLAWGDGTRWYLILLWPNLNSPNMMTREQLIDLAESLVDAPLEKTEALDPASLYSIADAEEVSGFDLKAPTLLPVEVSFSYARYYAYNNEVRLFYGINNELVIYQWKGKSLDLDTLSKTSNPNYEIVRVNGKKAFYGFAEGADEYLFLWWAEDGLYYQMYYYQHFGAGLDKEKMISIAESMRDINDFRTKDRKPYEYVSIYEHAFGFDAREFTTVPIGWSFANVSTDARGRCIVLRYTSTTEQGILFINQCTTDKYFDVAGIPTNAIEQAWIGNQSARYIVGDFVPGDRVELVWDPAAPTKRLSWQEDGLWVEISLYGKSTVRYSKKELITIAESLR